MKSPSYTNDSVTNKFYHTHTQKKLFYFRTSTSLTILAYISGIKITQDLLEQKKENVEHNTYKILDIHIMLLVPCTLQQAGNVSQVRLSAHRDRGGKHKRNIRKNNNTFYSAVLSIFVLIVIVFINIFIHYHC